MLLGTVLLLPAGAEVPVEKPTTAYYFHGALRCQSCLNIESLAQYVVETELEEELDTGQLVWKSVNYDEEKNAHFLDDFELQSPGLVVVNFEDGVVKKWERLDKVWDLYDDVEKFDEYVLGVVGKFLAVKLESRE